MQKSGSTSWKFKYDSHYMGREKRTPPISLLIGPPVVTVTAVISI